MLCIFFSLFIEHKWQCSLVIQVKFFIDLNVTVLNDRRHFGDMLNKRFKLLCLWGVDEGGGALETGGNEIVVAKSWLPAKMESSSALMCVCVCLCFISM